MSEGGAVGGLDLAAGVAPAEVPDGGMVEGHVGDTPVLLARHGEQLYATSARCTHYGAPLVDGLLVDGTVRCPWHHACFDLRTGEALRAPALAPIDCYAVTRRDGRVRVGEKLPAPARPRLERGQGRPDRIVIVGGGAAGNAAAERLRADGFAGELTLIGDERDAPYDRPNLSKDYLAGTAPEEWIPLRPPQFYEEQGITLQLGERVRAIDPAARQVHLESGAVRPYDRLLLCPGAAPRRVALVGADLPHVVVLRSLADSRALIRRAEGIRQAVVLGASFIGLEVAAALRARGVDVRVVAPSKEPLERVLGAEAGAFFRRLHEHQGVSFHLGATARAIDDRSVTLSDDTVLPAELVVLGVGVRPRTELAEAAGLAVDDGILVDDFLETSAPGVFAAGDAARFVDPRSGERARVEHWVFAERQGQCAARNLLGARERFRVVPFFWTQQYDVRLAYVGHAPRWDAVERAGSLDERDCRLSYSCQGRRAAVATVGRDHELLLAERAFEAELPA
jgi:NADPH-dependent 2,4-dienoyl-CoA reductase/sulfur reductase-like enzyme/nitrite reductase/ring-hydroxylating ferredoxin subunit